MDGILKLAVRVVTYLSGERAVTLLFRPVYRICLSKNVHRSRVLLKDHPRRWGS